MDHDSHTTGSTGEQSGKKAMQQFWALQQWAAHIQSWGAIGFLLSTWFAQGNFNSASSDIPLPSLLLLIIIYFKQGTSPQAV